MGKLGTLAILSETLVSLLQSGFVFYHYLSAKRIVREKIEELRSAMLRSDFEVIHSRFTSLGYVTVSLVFLDLIPVVPTKTVAFMLDNGYIGVTRLPSECCLFRRIDLADLLYDKYNWRPVLDREIAFDKLGIASPEIETAIDWLIGKRLMTRKELAERFNYSKKII